MLIGYAEQNIENTGLRLVQLQDAGEQQRSHLRYGGTHGMTLFAEYVIEADRACLELRVLNTELRETFLDESTHLTYL